MTIPPDKEFKRCRILFRNEDWDAIFPLMWPEGEPAGTAKGISFHASAAPDSNGLGLWVAHEGKYHTVNGVKKLKGKYLVRWHFIQGLLCLDAETAMSIEAPMEKLGFRPNKK